MPNQYYDTDSPGIQHDGVAMLAKRPDDNKVVPVNVDAAGSLLVAPAPGSPGGTLPLGTNRGGTATITSGGLNVAANTSRKFLVGQNNSTVNVGFNEFGGTAVIGDANTYVVGPGGSFNVSTQNLVNFIAASGTAAVAMTEG